MGITQSQFGTTPLMANAPYSLPAWWMQQWLGTTLPFARLQLAWLETLGDAMQHEAEFLKALAESGDKLARCAQEQDALYGSATLGACYQDVASEVTGAALRRMVKVTELSHDLRERIWDEI